MTADKPSALCGVLRSQVTAAIESAADDDRWPLSAVDAVMAVVEPVLEIARKRPVAPVPVAAALDPSREQTAGPEPSREHSGGNDDEAPAEPHADLLETAWSVIANAGWDGSAKSPGWQEAAERWREEYHRWLDLHLRPGGYQTWEELAVSLTRERDALLFEVSQLRRAAADFKTELQVKFSGDEEAGHG